MAAESRDLPEGQPSSGLLDTEDEAMNALFQKMDQPSLSTPLPAPPRFIAMTDELAEETIGKDFQFQVKKPNPPGQFTGRAAQPVLPTAKTTDPSSHPEGKRAVGGPAQSHHVLKKPLVLPELTFSSSFTPDNGGDLSHHFQAGQTPLRTSPPASRVQGASNVSQSSPSSGYSDEADLATCEEGLNDNRDPAASGLVQMIEVVEDSQPKALNESELTLGTDVASVRHTAPKPGQPTAIASLAHEDTAKPDRDTSRDAKVQAAIRIAPHILQASGPRRSSSPMSVCGDLERPAKRSTGRFASKTPGSGLVRRFPGHSTPDFQHLHHRTRSQSRTSNVSKKRSHIRKQHHVARSRHSHDRNAIMQELASHWNEYLTVADRDREQAFQELETLQQDIQVQATELDKATRKLHTKDQALNQLQKKCSELQAEHDKATADREELGRQIEALRKTAEDSKNNTHTVRERNAACRRKVNEALIKHQQLFRSTQTYCSDLSDRLSAEAAQRKSQEVEVQRALEKSRTQRKIMAEVASFAEKEIQTHGALKDEIISALQSRIVEQHQALSHVAYLEQSLQTQLRAQQATQTSVHELKAEIGALRRARERESDERVMLSAAADAMEEKLRSISNQIETQSTTALTKADAADVVALLRDSIMNELQQHTSAASFIQQSTEAAITSLGSKLEASVSNLRREVVENINRKECTSGVSSSVEKCFDTRFERLAENLDIAQAKVDRIDQKLDCMISKGDANAASLSHELREANDQLAKRDAKVNSLRSQLQLVSEDYHAKVEAIRDQEAMIAADYSRGFETQIQAKIHKITSVIEAKFEAALDEQRSECQFFMREAETKYLTAHNSLEEAHSKLKALSEGNGDSDSENAHAQLRLQSEIITQLKQHIAQQETCVEMYKNLEQRWRRDIEVVDHMRHQLKSLDAHAAKVTNLGKGLDRMVTVHDFLGSTADYLAQEHEWIRTQLDVKSKATQVSPSSKDEQKSPSTGLAEAVILDDRSQSLGTSQKEWERRRVTVQSPSGDLCSPSAPPSVEQERKRRRAGFETQSILRLTGPIVESHESEQAKKTGGTLFDLTSGHSRYFRPAVSSASAVMQPTNTGIIEQIREGLTRNRGLSWTLPTLADFQDTEVVTNGAGANHVDEAGSIPSPKRVKLESLSQG